MYSFVYKYKVWVIEVIIDVDDDDDNFNRVCPTVVTGSVKCIYLGELYHNTGEASTL